MSIWVTEQVFSECYRILVPGGVLRIVLPDVERSIREYLARNLDYPLFRKRRERAKRNGNLDYTLFDCLREDFLSRSGQQGLLGEKALAHQNAWDYESISNDLIRAGFADVVQSQLGASRSAELAFESSYEGEAAEQDRSIYVEATKKIG